MSVHIVAERSVDLDRLLGQAWLSAADALGLVVIATTLDGIIVGWNDGAHDLYGWTAADVLGRPAGQLTRWGVGQADAAAALLSSAEHPWVREHEVVAADGSTVAVRSTVFAVDPGDILVTISTRTPAFADGQRFRERRFQVLAERGTDLGLICDTEAVIRYASPAAQEMFGYHPAEVIGMSGWAFVHPADEPAVRARWDEAVSRPGRVEAIELRIRASDGSWRWVEERMTNLLDDPAVGGVVINIRDVTERRGVVDALVESEAHYRSIVEAAQEGVWVLDLEGRTVQVNAAMAQILGVDQQHLLGRFAWECVDPAAGQRLREKIARRGDGIRERYEVTIRRPDGAQRSLLISGSPLVHATRGHIGSVGMCVDLTDQKRHQDDLRRLALYDRLTGLPNRALFTDRLARLQERHERGDDDVAVLFCDLDRFKLVNDNRGHEFGDAVLVAMAERLNVVCRDGDTVARFGGDAFVILCPHTDAHAARRLASDICAAMEQPLTLAGDEMRMTVSVGVATTDDVPADELLQAAERAVHRAKSAGRARVEVHDPALRHSTEGRLQLLTDLRHAIEAAELELHYQPIVDIGRRIVGVEALLRWSHPQLGPVSPGELIPLAENNGLMRALGRWILERACSDIARRQDALDAPYVAVNLSGRQLSDDRIVEEVAQALRRSGLPADRLLVEVTETSVVDDPVKTQPLLQSLKDLGVRVALDDFGTGYSSLTYLRRFPVDVLKIDRSFVAGMAESSDDYALVASLVNLAATVGIDVVAEGVETTEQVELLRRLGCRYAQGFLWSPAVPTDRLAEVVRPELAASPAVTTRRPARRRLAEQADYAATARILALHRSGASPSTIASALNAEGRLTEQGTRWHRNTVARIIADSVYGSGGGHTGG